jgi:hypothetical protein
MAVTLRALPTCRVGVQTSGDTAVVARPSGTRVSAATR